MTLFSLLHYVHSVYPRYAIVCLLNINLWTFEPLILQRPLFNHSSQVACRGAWDEWSNSGCPSKGPLHEERSGHVQSLGKERISVLQMKRERGSRFLPEVWAEIFKPVQSKPSGDDEACDIGHRYHFSRLAALLSLLVTWNWETWSRLS